MSDEPTKPSRGNTSQVQAIKASALTRDIEALDLRIAGASFEEINRKLNFGGRQNAHRAVHRRLAQMSAECEERAAELRLMECMRLDVALAAIMPKVRNADYQAIDRMIRIQERRAAYQGLDQPRGLKVELAREIESFLERIRDEFKDDDVYERLLALFAGELGAAAPSDDPGEEGGEDGGGESEGGSGAAPAAT